MRGDPRARANKAEFFRWLQSYFAQYLIETRPVEDLVGRTFTDLDEAADAVYEAIASDDALKKTGGAGLLYCFAVK